MTNTIIDSENVKNDLSISGDMFSFTDMKEFTTWVCKNGFYYDNNKFISNPYTWVLDKTKLKTFLHYKEYTFEELYKFYKGI